jgi:hypothetical protein
MPGPRRLPSLRGRGRRSPLAGLALVALVGLALTAFDWDHFGVSWSHIRTALGESLIVAAALGLTVDFFYKRELARDAFEASLGYLLPDELKGELRWIYGQEIVAVQHESRVTLREIEPAPAVGPRPIRVEFETWRTMRNVSNQRVEHPTFASVEEWFRGEPSDVELIECIKGTRRYAGRVPVARELPSANGAGGAHRAPIAPSRIDDRRPGVEVTLDQRIVIEPGEEVTFRYRGHETHYESGAFQDVFGAPTYRPAIIVETPPGIRAEVWFGSRDRSAATEMGGRHVLPSVLLPFQPVVVRWWPEERLAAWHAGRPGREEVVS